MNDLMQKTALITGASSGIGRAIAIQLAKKRCNLICVGRDKERLESIKKEFNNDVSLLSLEYDLANDKQLLNFVEHITSESINIDILIHSAGIIHANSVIDSTLEEYYSQFNLNFKVPYLITKLLLSNLIRNKGQIVFINSSAIQRPIPNLSLYSASKYALKGFTDSLRQEVNKYGIRVVSVYPGQTATPMQQKLCEEKNNTYYPDKLLQAHDIASTIVNALELMDTAEITDLFIRPLNKV